MELGSLASSEGTYSLYYTYIHRTQPYTDNGPLLEVMLSLSCPVVGVHFFSRTSLILRLKIYLSTVHVILPLVLKDRHLSDSAFCTGFSRLEVA